MLQPSVGTNKWHARWASLQGGHRCEVEQGTQPRNQGTPPRRMEQRRACRTRFKGYPSTRLTFVQWHVGKLVHWREARRLSAPSCTVSSKSFVQSLHVQFARYLAGRAAGVRVPASMRPGHSASAGCLAASAARPAATHVQVCCWCACTSTWVIRASRQSTHRQSPRCVHLLDIARGRRWCPVHKLSGLLLVTRH